MNAAIAPDAQTRGYEITNHNVVEISGSENTRGATQIAFGGYSTAGLKSENQDAFAVLQPEEAVRLHKGCVAAIADGVSSSARSQEASQLSVTDFISDYYSTPDTWDVRDCAARVLNALNSWLYQHGNQGPSHASELVTTFSTIVIKARTAHIFHTGDSRIYRFRRGKLEQLTRDHSQREANGNMVLTNALGMGSHLEVDYLQHTLEDDDIFMLSTDGVHDFLTDEELIGFLQQPGPSLESLAQRLANTALSKGSDDNLSCLFLQILSLAAQSPDERVDRAARYVVPPLMEAGMVIDGFEILEKLPGDTVGGQRYLVGKPGEKHRWILKAACAERWQESDYLETFNREQWIGQRLDHPRIARLHPRPADTRFLYNIYDYTPGQSLRQWMHDHPAPTLGVVRDIVEQIASGLRALQRRGMMHRDLSPDNIRIDRDDRIKLVDLGTLQVSGLPAVSAGGELSAYAAPEYVSGHTGTSRPDIYSLGVIAYEMLCGELPGTGGQSKRKARGGQYRSIRLIRDDIPGWIDAALKKATAPSPQDRYQALSELCHDLRTPNQALVDRLENAPLLERHPLLFWQGFSLALLLALVWMAGHV